MNGKINYLCKLRVYYLINNLFVSWTIWTAVINSCIVLLHAVVFHMQISIILRYVYTIRLKKRWFIYMRQIVASNPFWQYLIIIISGKAENITETMFPTIAYWFIVLTHSKSIVLNFLIFCISIHKKTILPWMFFVYTNSFISFRSLVNGQLLLILLSLPSIIEIPITTHRSPRLLVDLCFLFYLKENWFRT